MKRIGLPGQACPEPGEVACALQSPASAHAAQNARARMAIPMQISFGGAAILSPSLDRQLAVR
jgi:hypothetical protein